jgi:hypothetical protein
MAVCDIDSFSHGLIRLGVLARQSYSPEESALAYEMLGPRVSGPEWIRFVAGFCSSWRGRFLPTIVELRAALDRYQGIPSVEEEAVEAWDRVVKSSYYSPDGGAYWDAGRIRRECGTAAAFAFRAIGGDAALRSSWRDEQKRERFIGIYVATVGLDPEARLLPPPEQRKLDEEKPDALPITREFAERFFADAQREKRTIVRLTDERLAALKRMGERVVAEEKGEKV